MKIYQSFFLTFFFALGLCYSQVTINNIQIASTIVSVDASTPNNPNSYTWSEISNTKQGVHISVIPPEKGEIYLQQNNSWLNYNTWNWGYMVRLEVSYDGGNWQTIFSNQTKDASGWIQSSFSTLGYHTISLKWISFAGIIYNRVYDVYVVPQSQKFYKDNYGNTLTTWEGGNSNKVVLISEGFDPYNTTYSEYLRYKGKNLFEPFIQAGYKIYFLNYTYNSQDMRNSSAIFNSASRYISLINSNTQMLAAGISMGGVVVRYALAKAENDGNPLPFNKFVSIDAPQQGVVFDAPLQEYFKNKDISDFQKHGLNNDAAKQLLTYNAYGNLHSSFYYELNNLNGGTGYPSLTENTGVSFSNGTPNPGSGRWVVITYESIFLPGNYIVKTSDLYEDIKVPGSYLPRSLVESDLTPFFLGMINVDRDPNNNPTFIPYNSALDIVNGNSNFDDTIQANANYFHDQFPPEVVTALINKFLPLTATISGPTAINWGVNATWNASTWGGKPPYHYKWWYKYIGGGGIEPLISTNKLESKKGFVEPDLPAPGYWNEIYIDSPTLTRHDYKDHYLKCVVTDAENTTVTSNILYITINGSSAPQNSSLAKNDFEIAKTEEKITENKLYNNYPNPFNPSTIISYTIKTEGRVSIKIYDTLGKEVATLVDEIKPAGNYEVEFNGRELPSGVYIYKMQSAEYLSTNKMLLVK